MNNIYLETRVFRKQRNRANGKRELNITGITMMKVNEGRLI